MQNNNFASYFIYLIDPVCNFIIILLKMWQFIINTLTFYATYKEHLILKTVNMTCKIVERHNSC